MKPYYDLAGITIYHGDCREMIPHIGDADLVLTDPPYGVRYVTAWRSRSDPVRTAVRGDTDLSVLRDAWPLVMARLAADRHWYCFASPRRLVEAMTITQPKQIVAWDKGDRGTVGDLDCGFGEAWEAILHGATGRRSFVGPRPRTVMRVDWSGACDPVHPSVKPVQLLARLIGLSSHRGELVVDPFMGSGTTLAAAKQLGRRAIGIEIEERYCEIAAKRPAQEVLPIEPPRPPFQTEMP